MFFTMADRIDRAVLSDADEELVVTCQTVKNDVAEQPLLSSAWTFDPGAMSRMA